MRFFFFLLLLSVSLFANPSWFYKIEQSKSNSYIGYGSATGMSRAKQEALNDITAQISVSVKNFISQNEKFENGKLTSLQESSSQQSANATLNDYKVLKMEYSDGEYFVAIEYENIPSLDKFVKKVTPILDSKAYVENAYLKHTRVSFKLTQALSQKLDFRLVRKDFKWFIKYNSVLQVLSKKDFSLFFSSVQNQNLSLSTNKKRNILYENDKFYFNVESKKDGYVSIVSVYEDGTVATLMRNIKIKKNKSQKLPDEEFESIPQAALMQKGIETFDLYVVVYSKKKLHFESFAYADEELISEEKYKNFDTLIEFLTDKEFATLKVVTKPRM